MFGERLTLGTLWCMCCCCCGCDICPSVQHKKAQRSNNYNHTMLLNVLHWQNVDIISIAECIAIHQCTGCKVTWHRQTSSRLPELMYVVVVHVTAPQTSKKLPVQISHTHIKQFVICGPTKCTVNAPYAYRTLCSVAYTEVQQVAWIVVIVVSHRQAPQFTTGIPAKTAVVSAWEVNHVPVCPMSWRNQHSIIVVTPSAACILAGWLFPVPHGRHLVFTPAPLMPYDRYHKSGCQCLPNCHCNGSMYF